MVMATNKPFSLALLIQFRNDDASQRQSTTEMALVSVPSVLLSLTEGTLQAKGIPHILQGVVVKGSKR